MIGFADEEAPAEAVVIDGCNVGTAAKGPLLRFDSERAAETWAWAFMIWREDKFSTNERN